MSYRYDLDPRELERIFARHIAPELREEMHPAQAPQVVVLGDQPASGKTSTARMLVADEAFVSERFFVPEGDALRVWHPDYARAVREDPLEMPQVTSRASGAWLKKSVELGFEQRASMLIEGTWRNPAVPAATLEQAREAGYRTHAVLVAVPPQVSRVDMLGRYDDAVGDGEQARWTPPAAHDEAVAQLEATAAFLADTDLVDTFSVITRDAQFVVAQAPASAGRSEAVLAGLAQAREAYWSPAAYDLWRDLVERNHATHREHTAGQPAAEQVWEHILTRDVPDIEHALARTQFHDDLHALEALRRPRREQEHAEPAHAPPRAERPSGPAMGPLHS